MSKERYLDQRTRAEDIILGALGFGEDASIISIKKDATGFVGVGRWPDGEVFEFQSEDEATEIELWALGVLTASGKKAA